MNNRISNMKLFGDIIFFMLLGSIPRLAVLFSSNASIESDEAIVGLMGLHITEGLPVPTFYYGQAYMGSLEAILASVYFTLFGLNNWALKLVPFTFSLLHIFSSYLLGFIIGKRAGGRIAALYVALAPCSLIIWSSKARGGFIETLFFGSIALSLTHLFLNSNLKNSFKKNISLISALGFVLGLGWWTNNQIVFFMAPIGLGILIFMITNRVKVYDVISYLFSGLFAFIIGGLPFWIYNTSSHPKWESFEVLFGKTAGDSSTLYFKEFWSTALPIILGASKFWTDYDIYPNSTTIVYTLVILLILPIIIALGSILRPKKYRLNNYSSIKIWSIYNPIILFFILTPIIFSFSSFGWLSRAPRYLLPMYSVIPALLALAHSLIPAEGFMKSSYNVRKIFILILGLLILNNLASNYLGGKITNEGQPMVYLGERVAEDHKPLYEWLANHNCTHINTNYWIGYRIAFETKEHVTFTRFGMPRSLRIPEYEDNKLKPANIYSNADKNSCGETYVLVKTEVSAVTDWLESTGQGFKKEAVGDYTVIYNVGHFRPEGIEIDHQSIITTKRTHIPPGNQPLNDFTKDLNTLFDKSTESRWRTGRSQIPGMAIELDFKFPINIGRIEFDFDRFLHDAPVSLLISGYKRDGSRVSLFDMRNKSFQGSIIQGDFPHLPDVWDIRFDPIEIKTIRFELMEGGSIFDWSIPELRLFEISANKNYRKTN